MVQVDMHVPCILKEGFRENQTNIRSLFTVTIKITDIVTSTKINKTSCNKKKGNFRFSS